MPSHSLSPQPVPPTVVESEGDDRLADVSLQPERHAPDPSGRRARLDASTSADGAYPQRFGRYTLLGRLASGDMADVYAAELVEADGTVKRIAIKRVLAYVSEQPGFAKAFTEEASSTAKIKHPNLCAVHEVSRVDDTHYVAMEYLHGVTLSELIQACERAGTKVPLAVVVGVLAQACEGLHFAHEKSRRLIHRALSPQNLFVCADGTVKVLDLGIRFSDGRSRSSSKPVKGKDTYMSPEQLTGRAIDRRTDVWSLGVVLYEALSGMHPFRRPSGMETLYAITRDPIAPLAEASANASAALGDVVSSALHRDAKQRLESVGELRAALMAAVGPANVADHPTIAALLSVFCTAALAEREELFARGAGVTPTPAKPDPTLSSVRTIDLPRQVQRLQSASATPAEAPATQAGKTHVKPRERRVGSPSLHGAIGALVALVLIAAVGLLIRGGGSSASPPAVALAAAPRAERAPAGSAAPMRVQPSPVRAPEKLETKTANALVGERVGNPSEADLEVELPSAESDESQLDSPSFEKSKGKQRTKRKHGVRAAGKRKARLAAKTAKRGAKGALLVDAAPRTTIFLDGKKLGVAPLGEQSVSAGRHTLRAVTKDGRRKQVSVVIRPGHTLRRTIL